MNYTNKGRLLLGSDYIKEEQKEWFIIEANLQLSSFTFIIIHDHMLVCKM